ncbi:ATP-binding protein [Phytohabitans kaempferiae]|uniref:ATP-binding protein n=1 Tax=Phytohabitans kaempferiae TaxID=1620943 RepID=A0ABV6M419_9ACTN
MSPLRYGWPIDTVPLLTETFERSQVTRLRHAVASCVGKAGLVGQRLDDFVLAVNELLTNAVRHGGGNGRLMLWRRGDEVVCEVSDHGEGFDDSRLASGARPAADTPGGWGLWLAGKLSDRMEVQTGPSGTTVRISAALGPAA